MAEGSEKKANKFANMDGPSSSKKKFYNMDKPTDVESLLNLLASGELSEVESNAEDSDDDIIDTIPTVPTAIRIGQDKLTKGNLQHLESVEDLEDEDILENEDNDDLIESQEISDGEESIQEQMETISSVKNIKWTKRAFIPPNIEWHESHTDNAICELLTPLQYFSRYITDEMFETMAECTNIYALQKGNTRFKVTNTNEIQTLIALHIAIGCLNKFPRLRLYWDTALGIHLFLDNMTRDRFFQLRTYLHCVNNLDRPNDCTDKFYKVRPLMDSIRKRCLELCLEEFLCIDEQMVPFTGKLSVKQYVKGKPIPCGIKIFVLCGKSGLAYDLIPYQGKSTGIAQDILKEFGLGGGIILHLCQRIKDQGHKLFYDNYFSNYKLLKVLKEKKIYAAGTVRVNRFSKPPLTPDKEMKKKERGFSEEVVSTDNIVIIKWLDNKTVSLASNFVGKGSEDNVCRWDKHQSKYVDIKRPEIIKEYNHSMGGVDLLDQMISLYRIFIRSKKWTLRLIMHFMDFALVNSWFEYKKDFQRAGLPQKQMLDLMHFRFRVVDGLLKVGKVMNSRKRGRPSSSSVPMPQKSYRRGEKRPAPDVQYDNTDHMPQFDQNKEATRCKLSKCKGRSHISCDKCKVHLCLTKQRNCFMEFHRDKQ